MHDDQILTFTPVDHPDPRVQQVGFDLTDPYLEQCWSAVVGPSSVLLLRRVATLWIDRVPAEIAAGELAQSLGLGNGAGSSSRFAATLDRVVRFGLARTGPDSASIDVHRQVAPLSPRQLDRLAPWTRQTHDRLFGERLDLLAGRGATAAEQRGDLAAERALKGRRGVGEPKRTAARALTPATVGAAATPADRPLSVTSQRASRAAGNSAGRPAEVAAGEVAAGTGSTATAAASPRAVARVTAHLDQLQRPPAITRSAQASNGLGIGQ